jgi:transposase
MHAENVPSDPGASQGARGRLKMRPDRLADPARERFRGGPACASPHLHQRPSAAFYRPLTAHQARRSRRTDAPRGRVLIVPEHLGLAALAPQKRGPKVDPGARIDAQQIAQLTRERDKLRELDKAELVIEVQKKVTALLDLLAATDLMAAHPQAWCRRGVSRHGPGTWRACTPEGPRAPPHGHGATGPWPLMPTNGRRSWTP